MTNTEPPPRPVASPDVSDPLGLTGRVAVVTGGSQGIGREIALLLGMLGCRVVVAARGQDGLDRVVEEMARAGAEAVGLAGDLRRQSDVDRLMAMAVRQFGAIDILVNNVGGSFGDDFRRGPLLELSPADVQNVMAMNVGTTFACSCAAVSVMRSGRGGSIVNISSVVVRTPMPEFGAYAAAKAAVTSLTQTMAIEWAPAVRVNAVLVGHIDTERSRRHRSPEQTQWLERHIALGRLGRPGDVAGAVAYLGSPLAAWVTGSAIPVDGGVRAL